MDYKAARWIAVNGGSEDAPLVSWDVVVLTGEDGQAVMPLFTSREKAAAYFANTPVYRPRLLSDQEIALVAKWRRNQRATHVAVDPAPDNLNLVPMAVAFIHLEMSFD